VTAPGWISTDRDILDITCEVDWFRLLRNRPVDALLAEHVWEHLDPQDGLKAARCCFRALRPGAYLRIAVPDGHHPDPNYIAAVRPGGSGAGAEDHRVLFNCNTLSALLSEAGFSINLLEWHDEAGHFHCASWDPVEGKIRRSSRFDPRNRNCSLTYMSLIVDAIKP
jgi:predicted SAM-dependent methyltransferase